MNPWLINPPWQHFSSLYRESMAVTEEKNEFVRNHHHTVALYFGISFVEALLNREYRQVLKVGGADDREIYEILRGGKLKDKVRKWPKLICGKEVPVSEEFVALLAEAGDVRNDITHPKTSGHDVYERMERLSIPVFVQSVAEYAVSLAAARGECFPYWLLGWNYVTEEPNSTTPFLINSQQFVHSMESLGEKVSAFDADASDAWRKANMSDVAGYRRLKAFLASAPHCECIDPEFPSTPRLCRRWWDSRHIQEHVKIPLRKSGFRFWGTRKIAVKWITPVFDPRVEEKRG